MTKILAIDLGTTFFKLTLFDRTGRLCESHRIAPPVVRPKTGWMELPAAAMEEAIAGGIRELGNCPGGGLADVEAVTFATQTNSFVLLGEDGRPLTPVILWPDARGAELEVELQEQYAAAEAVRLPASRNWAASSWWPNCFGCGNTARKSGVGWIASP